MKLCLSYHRKLIETSARNQLMPTTRQIAYVAVDDPVDLAPTLWSLQKMGFDFKCPEFMVAWFEAQNLPYTLQPMDELLCELADPTLASTDWIFFLYSQGLQRLGIAAQRNAIVGYLLTLQAANTLVVTQPHYYRLLRPEILSDKSQWTVLSRQFFQDIRSYQMLFLQRTHCAGDIDRPLYANNPAWAESIEILAAPPQGKLTSYQMSNVLWGTHFLIQLVRTEGIHPHQAILLQHGHPVHVACSAEGIQQAVAHVLFQEGPLTPGGTLIVSDALSAGLIQQIAQAHLSVVVSTHWDPKTLSNLPPTLTPVAFHLNLLQMSHTHLLPIGPNTLLFQSNAVDARQVVWHTLQKPNAGQRVDLEMGLALVESMTGCAVAIIRQQRSLAFSSGMATPAEAVDYCLKRISGEATDAVCILAGETLTPDVLDALVQARIAGLLLYNDQALPEAMIAQLQTQPLFIGSFRVTAMNHVLENVGIRHG